MLGGMGVFECMIRSSFGGFCWLRVTLRQINYRYQVQIRWEYECFSEFGVLAMMRVLILIEMFAEFWKEV